MQSEPGGERKRRLTAVWILSMLLTVGLGYLVLREMDFSATRRILHDAHWHYLPGLLLIAVMRNFVRGLRLHVMNPDGAGRTAHFLAICSQNFFFLTLPAVFGELALIYILRKVLRSDLHQSITNVAVGRFLDVIVYILFSGVIIAVVPFAAVGPVARGMALLLLTSILLCVAMVGAYRIRRRLSRASPLMNAIARQMDLFARTLTAITDRRMLHRVVALTVVNYLLNLAVFVLTVFLIYPYLSIASSVILNIFTTPVFLLPVKGVGNFGTHEAAYFYGLRLLGVETQDAIAIAIGTHMVDLMVGAAMTAAGLGGLYLLSRNRVATAQ